MTNSEHTITDVLERADAFVRTRGHDPYTRISEADELIEELSGEIERLRAVQEVALEMYSNFYHKGHPGRPCIRTGWVKVETYERWREALSTRRIPLKGTMRVCAPDCLIPHVHRTLPE